MEAPDKIYLFENPIDNTPDYRWLSKRSCNDDVEYVCKDAFIEKAVSFIRNCTSYDGLGYKAKCVNLEKFKKYMEE